MSRKLCAVIAVVLLLLVSQTAQVHAEDAAAQWWDDLAAGVIYHEGSRLSYPGQFSGAAAQYRLTDTKTIQGGTSFATDQSSFSFHGEFQQHFRTRPAAPHSVFVGGGFSYLDVDLPDDYISAYAPLGFRLALENYPVSIDVGTSVRFVMDPESSLEAFDEVRLGLFFDF